MQLLRQFVYLVVAQFGSFRLPLVVLTPVLETASSRLGLITVDVGDWSILPRWHVNVVRAVAEAAPGLHIHALSPEEVRYGAKLAKVDGEAPKIPDEETARGIVTELKQASARIAAVTRKERRRRPNAQHSDFRRGGSGRMATNSGAGSVP